MGVVSSHALVMMKAGSVDSDIVWKDKEAGKRIPSRWEGIPFMNGTELSEVYLNHGE